MSQLVQSARPLTDVSLECELHGQAPEDRPLPWACPACKATLKVTRDLGSIDLRSLLRDRPRNMHRYRELVFCTPHPTVGQESGWTPLVRAPRLGRELGLDNLFLKLDSYSWPSYSYKDRVVSAAVQRALDIGAKRIACASTGNVGNAVAALASANGLPSTIFYPAGLEAGKNVMSMVLGADVVELDGSYDDVNAVCRQLALSTDAAFVNLTLRPFYAEGAKTMAYEILEQMEWSAPQHVVVPTAGAALLTRLAAGFLEMVAMDMSEGGRSPRIHSAQAAGAAPIADAWASGSAEIDPRVPDTLAKSLAIGNPADGKVALEAIRASGGTATSATDAEIVDGIALLARTEGIFTEPAGGTTIAVTRRLAQSGAFGRTDPVVAIISGSGLKAQELHQDVLRRIRRLPVDYSRALAALTSTGEVNTTAELA